MSIHKDNLVGKYVEFIDREGKLRINKVKKVSGRHLTVIDAVKRRRRVHLDNVLCWIHHGHIREPIETGRRDHG